MADTDRLTDFDLRGVYSVLPTPFTEDGVLDARGLAALVEAHIDAGVAGLTMLGVMGEAAELDETERRTVLATARATAAGRPIIVGVTGPDRNTVRTRAAAAAADGAAAVMVSPTLALGLAEAVDAATVGLPIIVQDYPIASGVELTAGDIADAAVDAPAIVGAKVEAPPTSGKMAELRHLAPQLGLAGGLGALFLIDELAAGATAMMTGFPMPERLVRILETFDRDPIAAEADWIGLLPLLRLEAFTPFNLAVRKEVWRLRGVIGSSFCRRHGVTLDDRARADIRRSLAAATSDRAALVAG
jgi:4-hydroxy-tetrahydrodipicolinate synthase